MVMKRRSEPSSSQRRSLKPGNWRSRSSITAPTLPPSARTFLAPPATRCSGVGTRTVTLMELHSHQGALAPGALERPERRLDPDRPRDLVDDRLLGLEAVAGHVGDDRLVAPDRALLDQPLQDRDRHAAGALGEDPLGLGQQLDAGHDLAILGRAGRAA